MKRAIPALLAVLALGVGIAVGQVVTNPDIARAIACVYNLTPVTLTSGQVGWTQCDNAGSLKVTGTFTPSGSSPEFTPVAAAGATATNGVLLGGQYDSTQKTLTNGQQAAISASARGAIFVATGADAFTVTGAGGTFPVTAASGAYASGSLASGAMVDLTNLSTPIAAATATATKGILLGGQYDSTQKTLTNGQQAAVSVSPRGALYVGVGAEAFTVQPGNTANTTPWLVTSSPSAASGAAVAPVSSSALAANTVIKASAGNLYSFEVSADSTLYAAIWYIMIYNATSAPTDGAVTPVKCYIMPANTYQYAGAFPTPISFSTGITIGVSTTGCFTKTASTHAFISGDAQ